MFWQAAEHSPPASSCTLQLGRGPVGFISIPCQHIEILIIAFGWSFGPNQSTNRQYASPNLFYNLFLNSNKTVFLLKGVKTILKQRKRLHPNHTSHTKLPCGQWGVNPPRSLKLLLSGADQRWDTWIGTLTSCNHNKTHSKTDTQTKNEIAAVKEKQSRMLAASNSVTFMRVMLELF